jgi:hypothetical protein
VAIGCPTLWRAKETKGGEETEANTGIGGGEDDGCTEKGERGGARDWGGGGKRANVFLPRDDERHRGWKRQTHERDGGNAGSGMTSLWARQRGVGRSGGRWILGGGATRGWPAGGFREAATPWLDRSSGLMVKGSSQYGLEGVNRPAHRI